MGYNNERASLNQFSDLYNYCKEHVLEDIRGIYEKDHKVDPALLLKELPFIYEAKTNELVPTVSFDGGLATIFPTELSEVKLIKVAGACSPKWKDSFVGIQKSMFHILSGILKWPQGADLTAQEIINFTIDESLQVDIITEMIDHLGIDLDEYKNSMAEHLRYKKGNGVEDCFREIMEWALIVNFWARQKNNKLIDSTLPVPYLIVKDGSLYPFAKSVGEVMSREIEKFLSSGNVPIVGMVKASRFVSDEGSYRKAINKYTKTIKDNSFFQIPKDLETKIDSRVNNYERYFFSIFRGKSLYEVQIPKANIAKDESYPKEVMDVLNAQVTFMYGGTVSTNSFAHIEASLAESESRFLTDKLKNDLRKITGD